MDKLLDVIELRTARGDCFVDIVDSRNDITAKKGAHECVAAAGWYENIATADILWLTLFAPQLGCEGSAQAWLRRRDLRLSSYSSPQDRPLGCSTPFGLVTLTSASQDAFEAT